MLSINKQQALFVYSEIFDEKVVEQRAGIKEILIS